MDGGPASGYHPGVTVPCFWPGCGQQMTGSDGIASHLKLKHKVVGFGCRYCDFRHSEKGKTRLHIHSQHPNQRIKDPASASVALAHHYRRLYREQDSRARDMPDGAFWAKSAKRRPEGICTQCRDVITPYTGRNLIRHLAQKHDIVVDLNSTQLTSRHKISTPRKLPPDINLVLTTSPGSGLADVVGEEAAEENALCYSFVDEDGFETANDDIDDDVRAQGDNESDETTGKGQQDTKEMKASMPVKTTPCREFSVVLLTQFLSCVDSSSIDEIKNVFTKNETRVVDDGKYRVNKQLTLGTKPDLEEAVYAILTPGGWRCGVPQCGAVHDKDFAIDLHLNAHGNVTPNNWYCGEPTCYTGGHEKVYDTSQDFESHITTEHLRSNFSFKAARRAPKQEVLVSYLMTRLKFIQQNSNSARNDDEECTPASTTIAATANLTKEPQLNQSHDNIPKASQACDRMRRFLATDTRFCAHQSYTTSKSDEIQQHCDGPYVSQPPPSVDFPPMPPQYIVRTMYGGLIAFERTAVEFVNLYRQICGVLGTTDKEEVRRKIDLALDGMSETGAESFGQQERTLQKVQRQEGDNSRAQLPRTRFTLICPWPQCEHTLIDAFEWAARQRISLHLLTEHLGCVWQCPENGCEYCAYLSPVHLERHRMHCHVGSPLQCGHHNCNQVLLNEIHTSRGHVKDTTLRIHFESHFNSKLWDLNKQSSGSNTEISNETDTHLQQLPTESEYSERFSGKSSLFLGPMHRTYRQARNLKFLGVYGIRFENITVQGSMNCAGFWYQDRHFPCLDSVALGLDTAMVIFVPKLLIFTVASTCDHCIYVMSLIARPHAELPLPFHFGRRTNAINKRKRVGIGATINDHTSFLQLFKDQRLLVPPMAMKYKAIKEQSYEKIFIVDFESVRRSDRNVPLQPTEITVRNGKGGVIISCKINKEGVTNAQFEKELRISGYTDSSSFRSARRIRGGPETEFPPNAKTPREIVDTLCVAGLNPDCMWVEYSAILFDRKCMEVLIKEAGYSVQSILPRPAQCWTVFHDFSRTLPGLSSYRLGDIAKLLNPNRPEYKRLHYSDADTAVLYHFLESWIFVYGRQE